MVKPRDTGYITFTPYFVSIYCTCHERIVNAVKCQTLSFAVNSILGLYDGSTVFVFLPSFTNFYKSIPNLMVEGSTRVYFVEVSYRMMQDVT